MSTMAKTGWFKESWRHSMAARGVATRRYNVSTKRQKGRVGELLGRGVPLQEALAQAKGPAEEPPQRLTGAFTGPTFEVAKELERFRWFEDHPVEKAQLLDAKQEAKKIDEQIRNASPEDAKALQTQRSVLTTQILALEGRADDEVGVSSPRSAAFGAQGQITAGPKYLGAMEGVNIYQTKAAQRTARIGTVGAEPGPKPDFSLSSPRSVEAKLAEKRLGKGKVGSGIAGAEEAQREKVVEALKELEGKEDEKGS